MFESVLLPAPFSPSSACTSPDGRLEVDAVVRDDAREALGDPAHGHGHPRRGGRGADALVALLARSPRRQRGYPFGLPITPLTSQFIA